MLPNFIGIGVGKAGTTTLHDVLSSHPEVFLPHVKETHYFSVSYQDRFANALLYELHYFSDATEKHRAIGEFCPSYIISEDVAERMYDVLGPDLKIIVTLRNPVDRLFSVYKMYHGIFRNKEQSFKAAFPFYKDKGYHADYIENYLQYFPKENMKFILFEEDIVSNLDNTMIDLFEFLGVDSDFKFDSNTKSNPSANTTFEILQEDLDIDRRPFSLFRKKSSKVIPKGALRINKLNLGDEYILNPSQKTLEELKLFESKVEKPSAEEKQKLIQEYYYDDIMKTQELIGRDLSCWLK